MLDIFRMIDGNNTLHVKVTAKASTNRIKVEDLSNGEKLIRVYVTTAAKRGKANKEAIKLLAESMDVSPSALKITHGLSSNTKVITIDKNHLKYTIVTYTKLITQWLQNITPFLCPWRRD